MPELIDDQNSLLASLADHPGFKVVEEMFKKHRAEFYENFTKKLYASSEPVDQRVVDEKRGFYLGGAWFIREVKKGQKAFARATEEEVNQRG